CRAARLQGVLPAMALSDVAALLKRPAQPAVGDRSVRLTRWKYLAHDPAADLQALAQLAEFSQRFSPLVGYSTVGQKTAEGQPLAFQPGDCLFWDITGVSGLWGGETALATEAQ